MNGLDGGALATIITVIITLLVVVGAWTRVEKVLQALKEMSDVVAYIPKMLEDKKVTDAEIEELKKQLKEAIDAIKNIKSK